MKEAKNKNSLLFLYEGETEAEFYKLIFNKYVDPRKIRRNFGNLKGIFNLNNKVQSKITSYLDNKSSLDCEKIHIYIAIDREGTREVESTLDLKSLREKFIFKNSRVCSINEILATQDMESWLFNDLEGIYKYLKVPKSQRNLTAFNNTEATNWRILANLFHRHNKHYQKGKRVEGFLSKLDLDKIYNNVEELKNAITQINQLK